MSATPKCSCSPPPPTPLLFPSSPPRPAWGVALTPALPLQRCDLGMSLVTRGSRMRGAAPSQQVGAVADGPGPRSPSVRWAQGPHAPDAACCCRPGSLRPLRHPPPPPPLLSLPHFLRRLPIPLCPVPSQAPGTGGGQPSSGRHAASGGPRRPSVPPFTAGQGQGSVSPWINRSAWARARPP